MTIITIPQELIKEKELVLISRRKLEELLRLTKKAVSEITLSPRQKRALSQARKNRKTGTFLTLDELKAKLGLTG